MLQPAEMPSSPIRRHAIADIAPRADTLIMVPSSFHAQPWATLLSIPLAAHFTSGFIIFSPPRLRVIYGVLIASVHLTHSNIDLTRRHERRTFKMLQRIEESRREFRRLSTPES